MTNGAASNLQGSGASYTATIAPAADGDVTVQVPADAARDAAGNGNEAGNIFTMTADVTAPTVTISSGATSPVNAAFSVTITFNEDVTGFEVGEITVTNGAASNLQGSGAAYTATIAPAADGDVTVQVPADAARDAAGNGNEAGNVFTIDADVTRPTVTISSAETPPVNAAFGVTITFSEDVTGFEKGEIDVANGSVGGFSGSGAIYTATIAPKGLGEVKAEVRENVAEDAACNGNEAAEPFAIETALHVSFERETYTAAEGGEAVAVKVALDRAVDEEIPIPIRVRRSESTEADDYTVAGLQDWDVEQGAGNLVFAMGETQASFAIEANPDADSDDESVELSFGTLREGVWPGEMARAAVTLEDEGLLKLTVSFAQAEYTIEEGGTARVEIRLAPAADRRVVVPLEATPRAGTTREDYRGVPEGIVFEVGSSAAEIAVQALADEVNDPGEGIGLSFGELPEAVSGGEIAQSIVRFIQYRTPEQFSRTQEAALGVIGRAAAGSAQTAIQGRFERFRQWSRRGPAVPTPAPGSDRGAGGLRESAATASAPPQGNAVEQARPGPGGAAGIGPAAGSSRAPASEKSHGSSPGRWQWKASLGRLGSMIGRQHPGTSPRRRVEPGMGSFAPDRERGPWLGAGPPQAREAGPPGLAAPRLILAGSSFELSRKERQKEKRWAPVLWGQGDLQRFHGDLRRIGMNYRGGLEAAHLGLDLYVNERALAGLSFMRSWGNLDYGDDGVDGVLKSDMRTFHPSLYWQPDNRWSAWGTGALGSGHVEVREPGRGHRFDAGFEMFAGGVRGVLGRRGNDEWSLRADAFSAQLETDASEDIQKVGGEAHRGRLLLEWAHDRALPAGRSLSLMVEAGLRFDGGDAGRGSGMETGFRLACPDPDRGLDAALQGRTLLVHESDYRDWGVGVQARWDPGEKRRGLRVSVKSSLGRDGRGRTTLWDSPDAVTRPRETGAMGTRSPYRIESEAAYGMESHDGRGRITPYGRLRWTGRGQELRLGSRWSFPGRWQPAPPSRLELEGRLQERGRGPAEPGLLLRLSVPL